MAEPPPEGLVVVTAPALKIAEAAELANVSTKTIRRAITAGELRAYAVGRAHRIERDDFEAWFRANPVQAQPREFFSQLPKARPRRAEVTTPAALSVARMRNQDHGGAS